MTVSNLCKICGAEFTLSDHYLRLLDAVGRSIGGLPAPTDCPACRRMKRHAWQNERTLYKRTCSKTGNAIVSVYSPDKPFPVYHHKEWSSDSWDATDYGREFDFQRGFFEQFHELQKVVPRKSINLINCQENCEFNNNLWNSKNAFLTFMATEVVDSYYNYASYSIRDCMDVWYSKDIELSYRIALGGKLYHCLFCERCDSSNNLLFCRDLRGCSFCFGCAGLRNKSYYIYNQPVGKTEYERFLHGLKLHSHQGLLETERSVGEFLDSLPFQACCIDEFSQSCSGNFIDKSKASEDCFGIVMVEDSACLLESARVKNSIDLDFSYDMELSYDGNAAIGCYQSAFLDSAVDCRNSFYLSQCKDVEDSFGCLGLQKKKYCLLNKQYSQDEFLALRERVIEHMQGRGEWGQFFPMKYSDFGYNETDGSTLAPLGQEEVQMLGGNWSPEIQPVGSGSAVIERINQIPDDISQAGDSLCDRVFYCEETQRPFRFIPEEIQLYQRLGLALPRVHPLARYRALIESRGKLYVREIHCSSCGELSQSVYDHALDRQLCRTCYRKWQDTLP